MCRPGVDARLAGRCRSSHRRAYRFFVTYRSLPVGTALTVVRIACGSSVVLVLARNCVSRLCGWRLPRGHIVKAVRQPSSPRRWWVRYIQVRPPCCNRHLVVGFVRFSSPSLSLFQARPLRGGVAFSLVSTLLLFIVVSPEAAPDAGVGLFPARRL